MAISLNPPEQLLPVKGIRLATAAAGLRYRDRDDLVLMELCEPAHTVALFTTNRFCAAPVVVARQHLAAAQPRYLLINAGNANAGLGAQGLTDAQESCAALARECDCRENEVLPFSTGVIGERLLVEKITPHYSQLIRALGEDAWLPAARAIMTTDTVCKGLSRQMQLDGQVVTITGIAKGAGMIRPNMATMLAFIATDLEVDSGEAGQLARQAVQQSFHCITVDGDTSTNDACVLMTTARSGARFSELSAQARAEFSRALNSLFLSLAQAIVRDGEGITKYICIQVEQAHSEEMARNIAFTIAHSPLVKTSAFASDPNWGRIVAAAARAPEAPLEMDRLSLYINELPVIENGQPALGYTEAAGARAMQGEELEFRLQLGLGAASARIWTTDLSHEYVRINAEYRT